MESESKLPCRKETSQHFYEERKFRQDVCDRKRKVNVSRRRVIDRKAEPEHDDDQSAPTHKQPDHQFRKAEFAFEKSGIVFEPPRNRFYIDQRDQQVSKRSNESFREKRVLRRADGSKCPGNISLPACCVIRQKSFVSSGRSGCREAPSQSITRKIGIETRPMRYIAEPLRFCSPNLPVEKPHRDKRMNVNERQAPVLGNDPRKAG